MTVVYIDSVFALNTLVDGLLLFSAARLAGAHVRRWRFLLAALLGGAYAAAVFLPGCGFLALPPAKLAAGLAMALTAYAGEPRFLRLTVLLFLASCAFAGCVLALGLVSGSGTSIERGVFYTNVNMKTLLLSAAAAYLVLTVMFRASARGRGAARLLIPIAVSMGERTVLLTALCDTGNALRDPATDRPVLVAAGERMGELWPAPWKPLLTPAALRTPTETLSRLTAAGADRARFRLLPYSAVGVESGLLLAVRVDQARINGRRRERLLVALSPTPVGNGCDALWGELEEKT